jgi:hypothetical protein
MIAERAMIAEVRRQIAEMHRLGAPAGAGFHLCNLTSNL